MLILAFETSAKACSAALMKDGVLLGESYQNSGLTHSQTLLPMAQTLMKQCNVAVSDITAVAVASGPGSFTGVRIGVAAAKGFAWGSALPCCGVSTLEAMARHLGIWQGYVLAIMDARRQQVYTALFHVQQGAFRRVTPDRAISIDELAEEIKKLEEPVFLVGDGSTLCYNCLSEEHPGLVLPPEHMRHQRASGVALAAGEMLKAGIPCNGTALTPNYLRVSQAERERMAREKKE